MAIPFVGGAVERPFDLSIVNETKMVRWVLLLYLRINNAEFWSICCWRWYLNRVLYVHIEVLITCEAEESWLVFGAFTSQAIRLELAAIYSMITSSFLSAARNTGFFLILHAWFTRRVCTFVLIFDFLCWALAFRGAAILGHRFSIDFGLACRQLCLFVLMVLLYSLVKLIHYVTDEGSSF